MQTPSFCDGGGFVDYIGSFEFINAFSCTASDLAGGFVPVVTLIMGGIALSIYIRTGSFALPTVLVLLTGGSILTLVAAPALSLVGILVVLVPPALIAALVYYYSR